MCEKRSVCRLVGEPLELLTSSESGLVRLIKDIDAARKTLHLEFYIWAEGGLADEVGNAVLRGLKARRDLSHSAR